MLELVFSNINVHTHTSFHTANHDKSNELSHDVDTVDTVLGMSGILGLKSAQKKSKIVLPSIFSFFHNDELLSVVAII